MHRPSKNPSHKHASRSDREAPSNRRTRRRLVLEKLEPRQLLAATDLAAIAGLVFRDADGAGFTPGEQIVGATLNLFRDVNGNGVLDAGDGAALRTAVTDSNGQYRFDRLTVGNYFVQQPAQTVGSTSLAQMTSSVIAIGSADVQGVPGLTIDAFTTPQTVTATMPVGTTIVSALLAPEALGGERDMSATLTGGQTGDSVALAAGTGVLAIDAGFNALGRYQVVWDGVDNNASVLNPVGLRVNGSGVDLTNGGANSFLELVGVADKAGGTARIRVYTDATNFSQASVPLGVQAAQGVVLSLATDFTPGGGSGANFANVGAIELLVETTAVALDGQLSVFRMMGSKTFTADFANRPTADLSLAKTTSNPNVEIGQPTSFTVNLTNAGPDTATNVVVTDRLPPGLQFVSATTSHGSYDSVTGLWTVGTVPAGTIAILQVTATVTGATAITNTAEVTASDQWDPNSTPGNNNPAEDDQSSITLTPQLADLSLVKTIDNTNPILGQNVTFTLNVRNSGPATATNVQVTDRLPPGLVFVNATPAGVYNSGTGVWTVGTLANGANASLQVTAMLNTNSPVTNTAEVTASDQRDPNSTPGNNNPAEDDQSSVTITPQVADLSLVKTIDNPTPNLGQNVIFTLNLNNAGPGAATSVTVTDRLPPGLTFVNAVPSQGSYDQGTGLWTIGTVSPGSSASLQLAATVNTTAPVTNTAEVTHSDQPDPNSTPGNNVPGENDQSSITIGVQQADLSLTKTVNNAAPQVGENVTFTVTLSNAGPHRATGVAVRDMLPSGLAFVSSTPSIGAYNNGTGIWTVSALDSQTQATLRIVAQVTGTSASINTAEVIASDQHDPNSVPDNNNPAEDDQDSVTVTPQVADLSLTKTADPVRPVANQNVTFTITVSNAGPHQATGVAVKNTLPPGMTFVSATPSSGSFDPTGDVWTVGQVAANGTATLRIVARTDTAAEKTSVAEIIASDQHDPDSRPDNQAPDEDDQDSVTIRPQVADLSLSKMVDRAAPNVGDNVTFTVTLTNAGPDAATGVLVHDSLPPGISFVSSTVGQGTYNPTTGDWNVGTVTPGASVPLYLVGRVTDAAVKMNAAEVMAADQFDPNSTPGNNDPTEDDYASITATPQIIDLSLEKIVDQPRPNLGDNVTFTITLNNAGPDPATNVAVQNRMPAGVSYVSSSPSQGTFDSLSGRWTVGTVTAGTNVTLRIVARVTQLAPQQSVAEVITADQHDIDSTPGNNNPDEDDWASVTVAPQSADLSLTLVIDNDAPNVGDEIKFTARLLNSGPDPATAVLVALPLPTGLGFVSAAPSDGTYDSARGVWGMSSVAAGSTVTLEVVARVNSPATQTVTAEVVAADQADPDSTPDNQVPSEDDQDSVSLVPQVVDLSIVKVDLPDPVYAGRELTYIITVSNAGPATATEVVVTDTLPSRVSFVSAQTSHGSVGQANGNVVAQLNTLAPNASASITIIVLVEPAFEGPLVNRAEIRGRQYDAQPENNIDTTTTIARLPPARISGTVFLDLSHDGMQNAHDPPIAGVLLQLHGIDRFDQPVQQKFWTGPDGKYEFNHVEAGVYVLTQVQPHLFNQGGAVAGQLISVSGESEARVRTADEIFFKLGSGDVAENFNFWETIPVSLTRRRFLASS